MRMPTMRLNRVLLPTFGRPTMTRVGSEEAMSGTRLYLRRFTKCGV
jgi:hypothetical protein